jgi:dCMP deaminase
MNEDDLKSKQKAAHFFSLKTRDKKKKPLKRPSWEEYFLGIAQAVSLRSHDAETQVGVVVVDQGRRILATGYNGFPPGCDDSSLPNLRPDKYPFVVHAEINAIAASRQDLRNSTLYCTHSPCCECAKALITAGIKRIIFKHLYQNTDSHFVAALLNSCGVELQQYD